MTKKIFSLILCVVIAASVFAAVSVTAATDYKGAEITLDGNANACAITKNSPFKDLDFGESNTKNVEFTVYNNTSKRINQVYIAWEWATTLYNPDKETEKIDGAVFNGGIAPGASATFTLTLPKRASIFYGTYGIHNASYSDYNVRFNFDGAPASGEKIIVTSSEQSVINNLASDKGFAGILSTAGVNTLFNYKGAEITFDGTASYGIANGSPFKDLDFGSETAKRIEFTVYNTTSKTIDAIHLAYQWWYYKIRANTYSPKIEAGGKATFTLILPRSAEMEDKVVRSYKDINLRFNFADGGVPARGEKIVVTSNEQSVTDNLATSSGFRGIASIAGVNTLPDVKGAEITLEGKDYYAITGNSIFAGLNFGAADTKDVTLTVYNTTSKTIKMVYVVCEWWGLYAFDDGTTLIDNVTFADGIAPGEAAAFKFTLPKKAKSKNYDNSIRDIDYSAFNLRIDFDGTPASGEKIVITSTDQTVINNLAKAGGFKGITKTCGVMELPNIRPVGEEPDYTTGVKQPNGSITYKNGFVPTNDENILYSGRWSDGENGYKTLGFEGYVEIAFTGTSFTLIKPLSGNLYYSVDGQTPVNTTVWGKKEAILAKNLQSGEHTIRIYAQAQNAGVGIGGFRLDDGASTLPKTKGKIIEFIGDSITEGYVAPKDAAEWGSNSYMNSYARLTGEMLNKKYGMSFNTIAFGGCGLLNTNADPLPISTRYFKAVEKQNNDTAETVVPDWDMSRYIPDYIVINIGTNDRGRAVADYKAAYMAFVEKIRATYPNAEIVLMIPYQFYAESKTDFINAVKEISVGEKIHLVDTKDWNFKGGADGLHPAPAAHIAAAEKLFACLSELIDQPAFSLNLDAGKTLDFNYYTGTPDSTVDIIRGGKVVATLTGTQENGRYKFTYADIAPQSMADEITAELKVNGKTVATRTESIKSYCEKVLETADGEKYRTFMADMLTYGQALSNYKNLGKTIVGENDAWIATSKTDFATIKGELQSVKSATTATNANNRIISAGLYFYDINKIYFRAEINGGVVKINGTEVDGTDGKYYTDGIAASKFADAYTVTAEVNGEEVHKVMYSVNSYVLSKCDGDAAINVLARALGCYGYSATQLS